MDEHIRRQALDPHQSFIVEAPAGSGKTELLVQRFLSLLASNVRYPEEILAITFTRKAAHEMRSRIISALENTQNLQSTTIELAKKVLERDKKENWQLLANPNRLRIQTIDALCMRFTQQMPIISGMGGESHLSNNAEEIYKKCVKDVLATLDEKTPWQCALIDIFNHFDNQYASIESVFVDMLKKRDQWLPYIMANNDKSQFEEHLQNIKHEAQLRVDKFLPKDIAQLLVPIMEYTGHDLTTLLLTLDGSYRKQVDKRIGFPADAKNFHKKNMLEILKLLQDHEELRLALINLREAPPERYTQESWEFLQALLTVLPIMAAQLWVNFQQKGQVDFIEVSTRALQALGENENPTDLALVLDYQLQHILVDEFQDTSITQFRLLEKMTYTWQMHDGHTLFLVGDPMQSIYRFRQANVGLFLKAKQHGIGDIKLTPLQLCMNFRSLPILIDFINSVMPNIMPKSPHIALGAIPFTACIAAKKHQPQGLFTTLLAENAHVEAQLLITELQNVKKMHPSWKIAILVRARSHLHEILPLLKINKIAYHAVEIEPLISQSEVNDLLALTRALLDFNDKVAWLALFRSPLCGVELSVLEVLATVDTQRTLWDIINDPQVLALLSVESRTRITRLFTALKPTIDARDRMPLARWVESAWIALGGAFYTNKNMDAFYHLLNFLENEYKKINLHILNEHLVKLYSDQTDTDDNPVQVMTMHKAKGLEFDAVFLPGLARRPANNTPPVLRYIEQTLDSGTHWLLAPIHAKTAEHDPIYQYLGRVEKYQQEYETQRLLYVALTRAKQQLYLFAALDPERPVPPSQSLFGLLAKDILPASPVISSIPCSANSEEMYDNKNMRIPLHWQLPQPWQNWFNEQPSVPTENIVDKTLFEPEQMMRKHVGTLLHRLLKIIAEKNSIKFEPERLRIQLLELGVHLSQIKNALTLIDQALKNILADTRGLWILQSHPEAVCEYALHTHLKNKYKRIVIDRMFVYENERWIIDYKTGSETDDHSAQLQAYAQVMQKIDPRPIRLALYYPLTTTWQELL
ncbi:MAG: UvrD-helicase domain-containing protein [Legionellales bacterium]|jgi:ATP-dependent exoDNAse (exonuclease V) beta subunit